MSNELLAWTISEYHKATREERERYIKWREESRKRDKNAIERIKNKKYRAANKEKIRAKRKKYRDANKEKIRAHQKKYYATKKAKEAAR